MGETVLLLLVCGAITNYSEIVQLFTRHRGSAPVAIPWRVMLIRGGLLTLLCQVCFTLQDLYDWRVTSNPNQTSLSSSSRSSTPAS